MEDINSYFYPAILMLVAAVCYLGEFTDSIMLSMLLGVLACIAVALIKHIILLPSKKFEDSQKKSIQFYEKCVANGIYSFDSEKNRKRAELIAKELGYKENVNMQQLFEKGKESSRKKKEEWEEAVKNAHLAELAEKEKEEHTQLTKYTNCVGNEKTIQILTEEVSRLRSRYSTWSRFSDITSSALLEREKDWATAGGIASGIAGGAAGLAVAMDIQAQNAEIRARNARTKEMITNAQMHLDNSGMLNDVSYQLALKESELEEEKLKLVADIPGDEIIRHLNIEKVSVKVSETGAFRVKASVSMKEPLTIFDDLSARIDGTLICTVSQNGKTVGTAELVFPLYGVRPNQDEYIMVKGISLRGATPNVPCTFSFSGERLYAIEN